MRALWRWTAIAVLSGLAACGSGAGWEGRYEGLRPDGGGGTVVLVLQREGKGQWTAEQETTLLRWEERGGDLWLHLKTGGILVARPLAAEDAFRLDIPGIGTCRLSRTSRWGRHREIGICQKCLNSLITLCLPY